MTLRRSKHVAPLTSVDERASSRPYPHRYRLYALRLQSDFPLPLDAVPEDFGIAPDMRIARCDERAPTPEHYGALVHTLRCPCPAHAGRVVMRVYRGDNGCWIWSESAGTTHVSPDGRLVTVYPEDTADEQTIALVLASVVATYSMFVLGYPSLHAGAVRIDGDAVVFLGPKGRGKSTMVAGLLRRGAALIADDVLPLVERGGEIRGLPGLPFMKLWQSSVEHALELRETLPNVTPFIEKKLFSVNGRYDASGEPEGLRALYVLERYDPILVGNDEILIRDLPSGEALMALMAQTALRALLLPAEIARLMPLYTRLLRQAPVRTLRYPHGFEHQERVLQALTDDPRGRR